MEISKRLSIFDKLNKYDVLAKEKDFIEVTMWTNMDGFDVEMSNSYNTQRFQLTWGEFKALKKLVKKLENTDV